MSENTAKEGFITMKASQFHTFGGPEVLKYEEVPIPTLKPGEIRVRVKAIGLNPPDWYLRDGLKGFPPEWKEMIQLPMIPGTDVSGIVESITEDVADFAIGDEVFGRK